MKLRIFTEPQQGANYDTLVRVAKATEDLGFDAFFRSDHYLHMGGDGLPGPSDAWITLAGIARETSRIKLGTLVTPITFRYPGPLAISVANVADMSGGRVELGIGAGWFDAEHAAYAIPFPALKERFDRLEEQLAIITELWTAPEGETFSFSGEHYQVTASPGRPKPSPVPPIVMGGAGQKRTPRLAAAYADEFNFPFAPAEVSNISFTRVREECERAGRTKAMTYSSAQVVCAGADNDTLTRRAAAIGRAVDELKQNGLCGSAAEIVDKIGTFAEVGATTMYLQVLDLSDLDHLEFIAREVMPQL